MIVSCLRLQRYSFFSIMQDIFFFFFIFLSLHVQNYMIWRVKTFLALVMP